MRLRAVADRVYADFLMGSRLAAYRELLETALAGGYTITSVEAFWGKIQAGAGGVDGRHLVLRHDIDTDPVTAGAMWRIEQDLAVQGSYYFRLSTLDLDLMRAIGAAGGEASYHYEELATEAKRARIHRAADVPGLLPAARERFRRNLERLREVSGLPMRVVASHGDFVNRSLGVANTEILADPEFRRLAEIDLEVYDPAFMEHVTSRHSDTHHPRYWVNGDPRASIARGDAVVYVLVHPRHWRISRRINARDDVRRVVEGIDYRWPLRPASLRASR